MKYSHIAATIVVLAGLPVAAGAFFFYRAPSSGLPLALSRGQIVQGDYITTGDTIDLQGNVDGDVIVAASHLNIGGSVSGDVIAAASTLEITGEVEGDVRVAAMNVTISGTVGRSLNAWGSTVTVAPGATIGRNAYAVAESLTMLGSVGRNLVTRAARQIIGGHVGGDGRLELGDAGGAELLPQATVQGSLTYVAADASQLVKSPTTTVAVRFTPEPSVSPAGHARWFLFRRMVSLFGMLVVGLVLISLAPRYAMTLAQQFVRQPAWSLLWGIMVAVITPLLVVALAFTMIGLPLALILAAVYLISLYCAQVVAGITAGVWLLQRTTQGRYRGSLLLPLVAGMALYVTVTSFFGPLSWAAKMFAVVWGLGVIARMKAQELKQWR